MKYQLKHKVIGLALLSALIPTIVFTLLLMSQKAPALKHIDEEIDSLLAENLTQIVENIYASCATADNLIKSYLMQKLYVARYVLSQSGEINFSPEMIDWEADNRFADRIADISLPQLLINNLPLEKIEIFSKRVPVVDEIQDLVGGLSSIYQKVDDNTGMIRVATNIATGHQKRSIGSFMPAINPDGSVNPIFSAVLNGDTYMASERFLGGGYLVIYAPFRDETGNIIGAITVASLRKNLESIRKASEDVIIGIDGYVWALNTNNVPIKEALEMKSAGIEISKIFTLESTPIYENIRLKAKELKNKEIAFMSSSWKDLGESELSEKTIVYTYFSEWDLIIGATAYSRDFEHLFTSVDKLFDKLLRGVLFGGLISLIIMGIAAFILGKRIVKPITALTRIALKVAKGDISAASTLIGEINLKNLLMQSKDDVDETHILFSAITEMIESFDSLIGQVKRSSIQLLSTANEISATSRIQETTVNDFSVSTNEIAVAVKEISSTSKELYKTMSNVSDVANATGSMADAGLSELTGMEATMQSLTKATTSISSKLSAITDKAGNINSVVTTITKVADQTNLLSLNAAIEAEKAGEYGLGFAVVAREIRRLADQTAVATLDIEEMVKEMQSAVSVGVMEMDKFTEEVRSGADEVGRISGHLETIIIQVQELSPRFESVKEGMQSQSQGAHQINDAMANLTGIVHRTTNSLKEFDRATQSLHKAVDGLRHEVVRFKIDNVVSPTNFQPPLQS